MDFIYYISALLIGLLVFVGPFILLAFTIWPQLFYKFTKRNYKRKKIIIGGVVSGLVTLIVLSTLLVVFEPAGVKAERLAQEKAETAQKASAEKRRLDALKPVKKVIYTKSKITFKTVETEDASIQKGEKKVSVEGVDGENLNTYEVTYVKGVEVGRKLLKAEVTKPATDKTVLVGTYVAPTPVEPTTTYSEPAQSSSGSVYYANCTDARNAGAAPIYSGQPGYRSALDRDHDGVACE